MSSAQMSLRDQEQVISRLRVILQTISKDRSIYPITLSIFLFLRSYCPETYILAIKNSLTAKDFISFVEALPNEKEAFSVFSNININGYKSINKDIIEGVFLAGLNEFSGTHCSEVKEYLEAQNSSDETNQNLQRILNIALNVGIGFKETEKRLNLTSNFGQN